MKFFTHKLQQQLQTRIPEDFREAIAKWDAAKLQYEQVLNEVRDSFPRGVRDFLKVSLHDAVIKSVEELPKTRTITITLFHYPSSRGSYPGTRYFVTFHGTLIADGLEGLIGETWLYEEMHPSDAAAFEFHVLCEKSEFRIVANDITLTTELFWPPDAS